DIFAERIANRTVHECKRPFAQRPRQLAQEPPALGHLLGIAVRHFELLAGPKNGPLGPAGKAFRIIQSALIVIAEDRLIEAQHAIDALAGIRPVADDIAQAIDAVDALAGDVGQDGFERLEITVNIADNGPFHATYPTSNGRPEHCRAPA